MKKITFLAFLFVTLIGFSQELITNGDFQTGVAGDWYSGGDNNPIEVVDQGGNFVFQANVTSTTDVWRVNLSQVVALQDNTSYELVFDAFTDATTGTRTMLASLGQAGAGFNGTDPLTIDLTDTPQTFTRTITTNFDTANTDTTGPFPGSRVIFDMGGDTGFVFIDNVSLTETTVDPTLTDVTLSDLQLDNSLITGFDPNTTTYNIALPDAMSIPQITSVSTTNPNATVGTLNQATAVPGTATFDVTSEDTTVTQTYTINFTIQGELTELVGNGSFETGDYTDWQQFESTAGNQTITSTNPSEGAFAANINNVTTGTNSLIKSANRGIGIVNAGNEVTIKFDLRGTTGPGGVVFVELFSELAGGGTSAAEILGGGPIALNGDPNVWTSYEFTTNVGPNVDGGITLQFGAATAAFAGSFTDLFIDNVSMVNNDQTLSINNVSSNLNVKIYPNPTVNNWIIESSNNQNITSVEVYDILGKEVLSLKPNTTDVTLDASSMKSGIYIAKLSTVNGSKTVKLIKQ
ncbi:Por secretion system C-terminal sorting domain-containing protein [Formosa sp. Hel1_31_208]|uniref:T9SS type A sorting domain-containing protein n=1 Tax=Formosa sp. Hel1_31_208 TaxID=1798225 RepID=UPI00087C8133|nr:T9SS type A sorting domain-containing protein [Formosa sp. Hel1_31_208]SDS24162.1 Por secretion system C-terminal sorting domain-containing protein [Formosa sp. Hel1_31_208]